MASLDDILAAIRQSADAQQTFQNDIEVRLTAIEQRFEADGADDMSVGETGDTPEGEQGVDADTNDVDGREGDADNDGDMDGEERKGDEHEDGEERGMVTPMTRAEIRRAARERNKRAASQRFGDHVIKPEGSGPSLNRDGFGGLSVGKLVRSVLSGGAIKEGHREMELLEARQIVSGRDSIIIPFDLPSVSGKRAAAVDAKLDSYREVPIHAPHVEQIYDVIEGGRRVQKHIGSTGHARALSAGSGGAGSGGAMVGVDLDVARSQMWLREISPVMAFLNPVMGVESEYQIFYGGVTPQGAPVAEGGGATENAATLVRQRRDPVPVHFPWSFTGNLLAMDAVGIESLVNDAIETLMMQEVMLNILSGPNAAKTSATDDTPTFGAVTTSFNGLLNSGISEVTFGQNSDTAITGLDRGVIVANEEQLNEQRAMGENPFWLTTVPVIKYARDKRTGGSDSPVYLVDRDKELQYQGLIGGAMNGEGSRYVASTLFGKTNATAFKRTAYLAYLYGSQFIPIFYGQGIEIRVFRPTDEDKVKYSLTARVNCVMVNPKNGIVVKQA